jgi:hypothetical protein
MCAVRLAKCDPPADRDPHTDLPLTERGAIQDPALRVR